MRRAMNAMHADAASACSIGQTLHQHHVFRETHDTLIRKLVMLLQRCSTYCFNLRDMYEAETTRLFPIP